MSVVIINSFDEYKAFEGKVIGTSEYLKISQDQIGQFADATLDHQWIHLDKERAEKESPFKSTIAHGYLTLSLLPYLWEQIAEVRNNKMMVNYGIENFKFVKPVLVDSEIRLVASLKSIVDLRGTSKAVLNVTIEIKGERKPAAQGDIIFLYTFTN
ncbi:MaoC family dehydratase [Flavicella sp.]|uniref:MaoC family dehydratase n=1 Tax=Flavicella sp. TaxID=2957742 RepID=UPI002631D331|nr:MaoC family dehydratase [Flavicella sp.]MDG1803584.1 MaoC family dehydratase [Flavicella sp.]MDG2279242.1 MaoC family dehydratase [Flavicella sp.]